MKSIICHYLNEIREFTPGPKDAVYDNMVRILRKYDIESDVPLHYHLKLTDSVKLSMNRWFTSVEKIDSKTPSLELQLKRKTAQLQIKTLLREERERLEGFIKNKIEFDPEYSDYLIMLRCIRVTICNPRPRDASGSPTDLEHARNSTDLSILELLIIYWSYSLEAPDAMKIIFDTPNPWPGLFVGAGGGVNQAVSLWNTGDIYYACVKLHVALRKDFLKLNGNTKEILKFQHFCMCILYRIAQLTLFPILGEPMNISPLRPMDFQVVTSGYDPTVAMREKQSYVSEEVRLHIRQQNHEAMVATFGEDYKEMLDKNKVGNTRMRSKDERAEEWLWFYNQGQLQAIEDEMEIIQKSINDLLGTDEATKSGYENLDPDVRDRVKRLGDDLMVLILEKKDIEQTLDAKRLEEEKKKREMLKRIYQADETDELPESRDGVECGMTKTGVRDLMIYFDMIQFKSIPSTCMVTDWPEPKISYKTLRRAKTGFLEIVVNSVLNVNEDTLLATAHDWILDHMVLNPQQKISYMVKKNKNKKIKALDIWKYYTPTDKNPGGQNRIPGWRDDITKLLERHEDNDNYHDAMAFACDYWLSQHLGKSFPTERSVFIWDIEENLFDLKCTIKQFPYIVKIGNRWGIMFSWDKICDAGPDCEDAIVRFMWEIQKRNWTVIDRFTDKEVTLVGTSIYNTFKDLF